MQIGDSSKTVQSQALFWSTDDPSARAIGALYGLFGYWQIGAIEILRIGWGAIELARIGGVFGLRLCGFAIGSWTAPRSLSRRWTNA